MIKLAPRQVAMTILCPCQFHSTTVPLDYTLKLRVKVGYDTLPYGGAVHVSYLSSQASAFCGQFDDGFKFSDHSGKRPHPLELPGLQAAVTTC